MSGKTKRSGAGSKTEFDRFVKEQIDSSKSEAELQKEKEIWLAKLDELYSLVDKSLAAYTYDGRIKCKRVEKTLYEEPLGRCKVDELHISIGSSSATLEPVSATDFFGVRGRVDMMGPRGDAQFVLVPADFDRRDRFSSDLSKDVRKKLFGDSLAKCVWKIETPPPIIKYINLTQETFRETLMGVVNGQG